MSQLKEPSPPFTSTLLLLTVGLADVDQQTPLFNSSSPPDELMWPPVLAVVEVILDTFVVDVTFGAVGNGISGSFSHAIKQTKANKPKKKSFIVLKLEAKPDPYITIYK
jgi:hypothetical protein